MNIGLLETLEFCSVKILNDSRYDLTTAGCQVSTDDVHTHNRSIDLLTSAKDDPALPNLPGVGTVWLSALADCTSHAAVTGGGWISVRWVVTI